MSEIKRYLFLFVNKNICCDPPLEPSRWDGSNERSQNMFLRRNIENFPLIILLPFLIWSSAWSWEGYKYIKLHQQVKKDLQHNLQTPDSWLKRYSALFFAPQMPQCIHEHCLRMSRLIWSHSASHFFVFLVGCCCLPSMLIWPSSDIFWCQFQ